MDWLPTLLAAAGTVPDPAYPPDGTNLLPFLTGRAAPVPRTLYWRYKARAQRAMRDGDLKFLKILDHTFLFDVVADPLERANLKERRKDDYRPPGARSGSPGTRRCCRRSKGAIPADSAARTWRTTMVRSEPDSTPDIPTPADLGTLTLSVWLEPYLSGHFPLRRNDGRPGRDAPRSAGGPLRVRARARARRHGHRLPRARPAARPPGRAQGPAPRARRRRSAPSGSSGRSGSPPGSSILTSSRLRTTPASGRTRPALWFAMPFVEGEIAPRSARPGAAAPAGRRAPDRAGGRPMRSTTPTAQGIIHRDIKPENILLDRRRARAGGRLRDRARRCAGGAAARRLTETGLAARHAGLHESGAGRGRARARRAHRRVRARLRALRDARGRAPFTGPTAQAMLARRFTESPRPLRAAAGHGAGTVEQAVAKALARSAADRFGSAAEFARALEISDALRRRRPLERDAVGSDTGAGGAARRRRRRTQARRSERYPLTATLALGFLIGLGVLFGWLRRHNGEPSGDGARRLAVLPFENLGDRKTDTSPTASPTRSGGSLSALPGLQVTARSSSAQYKGTSKSPAEIGRSSEWIISSRGRSAGRRAPTGAASA